MAQSQGEDVVMLLHEPGSRWLDFALGLRGSMLGSVDERDILKSGLVQRDEMKK